MQVVLTQKRLNTWWPSLVSHVIPQYRTIYGGLQACSLDPRSFYLDAAIGHITIPSYYGQVHRFSMHVICFFLDRISKLLARIHIGSV